MNTQLLIYAISVKQVVEHVARPDKPASNGKHMNARKAMDLYRSGACTRLRHHILVPSQYRGGRP